MGRTEPTFRHVIDRLEVEWQDYRRALRRHERDAFDTLFQRARAHASACTVVARADPMEAVFLSVLLEQEVELERLRGRLDRVLDEVDQREKKGKPGAEAPGRDAVPDGGLSTSRGTG